MYLNSSYAVAGVLPPSLRDGRPRAVPLSARARVHPHRRADAQQRAPFPRAALPEQRTVSRGASGDHCRGHRPNPHGSLDGVLRRVVLDACLAPTGNETRNKNNIKKADPRIPCLIMSPNKSCLIYTRTLDLILFPLVFFVAIIWSAGRRPRASHRAEQRRACDLLPRQRNCRRAAMASGAGENEIIGRDCGGKQRAGFYGRDGRQRNGSFSTRCERRKQ